MKVYLHTCMDMRISEDFHTSNTLNKKSSQYDKGSCIVYIMYSCHSLHMKGNVKSYFCANHWNPDATDLPFNIQIQTARTNSLTVTWNADFTPPTNNRIQLQYRPYGTTTWIPGPRVTAVSQGIADIPSLRGNEYYEVRIYVGDLDLQLFNYSLVNRFYTCEPNRVGPNCENGMSALFASFIPSVHVYSCYKIWDWILLDSCLWSFKL